MKITISQLNHFIVLANELHFRRAADLCNVAQPVLTRSIQSLENEIGFKLFKRNNRNVELTEAAKAFLPDAVSTVQSVDSNIRHAREAQVTNSNRVRVGFSYVAICGALLPEVLRAFQKNNSNIKLDSLSTQSHVVLERLHHGELDFGFLDKSNATELNFIPFQANRYTVLVRYDHPLAASGEITLEQLQQEKILMSGVPERRSFRQQILNMIRRTGYELNIEFVYQDPTSVIDFVVLGKGVAIYVENLSLANDTRTTMLELQGVEEKMETVFAWKGDQLSTTNKRFLEFVQQSLSKDNLEYNDANVAKCPAPSAVVS